MMRVKIWPGVALGLILIIFSPGEALDRKAEDYIENAKLAQRSGDHRGAVDFFTKAIRMGVTDADVYYRRGLAYEKLGDNIQAISDYTRAIQIDSRLATPFNNRGSAYYRLGDFDKAIEIRPGEPDYYDNKARALLELEKPELAMAVYEEILQIEAESFSKSCKLRGLVMGECECWHSLVFLCGICEFRNHSENLPANIL